MINVGIIGYGYWGPNVARNFYACPGVKLAAVCDGNKSRLDLARNHYPSVRGYSDHGDLIRSKDVDVVAVVTPVFTHYELAREALENGKHIFVEKPFTANRVQAEKLISLAAKKKLKIMVDHTFLFTGAVKKMRDVIDSGEMGKLFFYDSVRVNLGLFQHDVNVVWDLAPHDFSIMSYLIKDEPIAVTAHGSVHFGGELEDVAYIVLHFQNSNFIAHFHLNWLSPVKIRSTLISGDRKMLVWDDLSSDEKIKIYDRGVTFNGQNINKNGIHKLLVSYRSGDMYAPKVDTTEALKREVEYFVRCLERNEEPFNDGRAGLQVVRLLEASDKSIRSGGRKVRL
jgi:predicted dehydrogenase